MVIVRAIIRFATVGGSLYFFRQCGRPFLPSEVALLGELDSERNACAYQGCAKTGPPSSRGSCGSAAKLSFCEIGSNGLKVVIPHVQVDRILRRCFVSP